jgi:hypothetical protein
VSAVDSPLDATADFALRKATVGRPPTSTPLLLVPSTRRTSGPPLRSGGRRVKEGDLSDMAKVVLAAIDADPTRRWTTEYRPDTFADAERAAAEWATYWFEPAEVRDWLAHHRRISPVTAYALKQQGLSAADAAEPMRYNRNVAIAVSCGDLTAAEAAAELKARRTTA